MAKAAAIYLIEDDESIRELVLYALESAGYAVRGFADGGQFWQALAEGETPGLILLDIMLPGEDGLTILRRLKASAAHKKALEIFSGLFFAGTDYTRSRESAAYFFRMAWS